MVSNIQNKSLDGDNADSIKERTLGWKKWTVIHLR
jgi:hypothetical protein